MNSHALAATPKPSRRSGRLEEHLERVSDTVRIRRRVREHLRQSQLSEQGSEHFVLCLQEACANALRHSGSSRPTDVSVELRGDEVVAVVTDHGHGFDVDRFDASTVADPTKTGGRGLWLMARLMDDLELVLDDGLTVRMTKRCALRARGKDRPG